MNKSESEKIKILVSERITKEIGEIEQINSLTCRVQLFLNKIIENITNVRSWKIQERN